MRIEQDLIPPAKTTIFCLHFNQQNVVLRAVGDFVLLNVALGYKD